MFDTFSIYLVSIRCTIYVCALRNGEWWWRWWCAGGFMEKKLPLMDTIALCNTWKPHDRFVCSNTILTLTPAPNLLSDININIIMGSIEPFNIYVEMNIFFFRRYFLSPTDVSVCECVKCHVALNKFRSPRYCRRWIFRANVYTIFERLPTFSEYPI